MIIFEKEYGDSLFAIKEQGDLFFLFIDNELISQLDIDEIIDYNIYNCIPYYIKELYLDEIIKKLCYDINNFVNTWQW